MNYFKGRLKWVENEVKIEKLYMIGISQKRLFKED